MQSPVQITPEADRIAAPTPAASTVVESRLGFKTARAAAIRLSSLSIPLPFCPTLAPKLPPSHGLKSPL